MKDQKCLQKADRFSEPLMHEVITHTNYSRTRIKETRIKETFGYKKRFHSSDFMQVKPSTLIGQLIKETMDKRNPFLTTQ